MAYFEFISNNALVATIVAAALLAMFSWVVNRWRDYRDSKKLYGFLRQSKSNTTSTFRSTEAISSATNIPENRVAELCSRHPNIKRNEKEKQSWQLTG